MKTLIILLLGAILGVLGYQYYQRTQHPTLSQRAGDVADKTRDTAGDLKDTVVEKSRAAGEKLDDARIVAAIKGKFVMEKDLPALAISVASTDGHVTLTGTLESEALILRAVKIARETGGVTDVSSKLKVRN
jgi:hyperosmotically inducible periplasmic protein